MKGFCVLIAVVFSLVTVPVSAAIYRCATAGKLVYSDHKCGKHAVKLTADKSRGELSFVKPGSKFKPVQVKPTHAVRATDARQPDCPLAAMSSTERRNMRVSHVIMVCEPADEVRAAWGRPDSIKHTVSSGHEHEHWVYDGPEGKPVRSVDFKDGRVTSFRK